MDLIVVVKALIMGVVEGLTEFLPVSSTGHLIVVGSLLDWNDEKGKLFEIVIQFAAILAVCWLYRQRLWTVASTLPRDRKSQRFTLNLVLAFLPAAVLGVIFINTIKKYLFAPVPVATAFIIGGILILWIESRKQTARISTVDAVQPPDAIWIGFAQALSMIPGTSRSGATIMGGLLRGLSRHGRHRVFILFGDSHHIGRDGAGTVQGAALHRRPRSCSDRRRVGSLLRERDVRRARSDPLRERPQLQGVRVVPDRVRVADSRDLALRMGQVVKWRRGRQ